MEYLNYLNYLIYPIAGLLCILALGGLNTKHPVVLVASIVSLILNGYAIIQFIWWPIPVSLASDFLFKVVFGDPGAKVETASTGGTDALDVYLLSGFPLIMGKLQNPVARMGAQIFILGMVDMKRCVENLSIDDLVGTYDSILARHDLSLPIPTADFVQAINKAAPASEEIQYLMNEGALSIKNYIVDRDVETVADLGRAVMYAEQNEYIFASLPGLSKPV